MVSPSQSDSDLLLLLVGQVTSTRSSFNMPYGIRHKLIPVAMPKQNGKVERLHRTLDEECLNSRISRKPAPREHPLCRWLYLYNHQRPHSSLGWLTPLQKLQYFPLYQSVTHV